MYEIFIALHCPSWRLVGEIGEISTAEIRGHVGVNAFLGDKVVASTVVV